MARKRTIPLNPVGHKNYFVVDANVLAYVALPKLSARSKVSITDQREHDRATRCLEWWQRIKAQVKDEKGRVYVPDVYIAEAFKVLAKWYFKRNFFLDANSYNQAKWRLRKFVSTPHTEMAKAGRIVKLHDIKIDRDIIISVDRFFESLYKTNNDVSIVDLIVAATAKYIIDFYDVQKEHVYILTCDRKLARLINRIPELPNAIDPVEKRYEARKTFVLSSAASCWRRGRE